MKILGKTIREIKATRPKREIQEIDIKEALSYNIENRAKSSQHKTYQFDLDGNFIAEFESVKVAAESVDGVPKSLSASCNATNSSKNHKYKGYLWSHNINEFKTN